ncbi:MULTISPECIES: sporulation membrane protein YtaF [unclassified Bacillus (in: firmicutes)]|uniref:sporulation membrane protein YtaF n=1 Tax=unclassified Bacillus (in: firmicutes) TaxID=185979 RepID=UPI002570F88B|nr:MULTISPECIES: sporulation membrane protein YtaF [unclassified Bacillus (in: firmicutes)]
MLYQEYEREEPIFMVNMLSLILLACALSLDSCSVGFTYGLRKVKIPLKSIITIASCSGIILMTSMGIGHAITDFFSPIIAKRIGGFVLVCIGLWVLFQFYRSNKGSNIEEKNELEDKGIDWEFEILGVVVKILKKPTTADIDRSGSINGLEAMLLGFALSLDAFGAGIGASLLGFSPLLTAIVTSTASALFLLFGMKLGNVLSKTLWLQKLTFLPGVFLILIGLMKM